MLGKKKRFPAGLNKITYSSLKKGELIGEGGFGNVYRGTWGVASKVAIKELKVTKLTPKAKAEFKNEVTIWANLRHPQVVQLFGACLQPYVMVMELMPGGSLYDRLHDGKPLEWTQRIQMALQIGSGLGFLHQQNILHRDLKSLNVLLDGAGRAKLTDFGLSQVKTESSAVSTKPMVGSLLWMAPELFKRRAKYTKKSDVYALGVVLWELAARALPFADANGNQALVMEWVKEGEREEIPAETPAEFKTVIERCWAQEVSARPTTQAAQAALTALASVEASQSASVTPRRSALPPSSQARGGYGASVTTTTTTTTTSTSTYLANNASQVSNLVQLFSEKSASRYMGNLDSEVARPSAVPARTPLPPPLSFSTSPAVPPRPTTTTPVSADIRLFARSAAKARKSQVNAAELQSFLNHVVMGEQDEAEGMLQATPALALAHGDVDDLPNGLRDLKGKFLTRHFEHITGFQYALWAGDWHMWRMIQNYLPEAAQRDQLEAIVTDQAPWIAEHGRYFDLGPLVNALKTHGDRYSGSRSSEQWLTYWCHTVGGLERQLPVQTINEYCRSDRPLAPIPDFRDGTVPSRGWRSSSGAERGLDWWLAAEYAGGRLGEAWAAYRGNAPDGAYPLSKNKGSVITFRLIRRSCLSPEAGEDVYVNMGWPSTEDAASLDSLSNTRRQQVEELAESLGLTSIGTNHAR